MRWPTIAAAYTVLFMPYAIAAFPLDRIFLALYVGATIWSTLIASRKLMDRNYDPTQFYGALLVSTTALALLSALLAYTPFLVSVDASKYVATTLVFFFLLVLVVSPCFRLAKLGKIVREFGLSDLQSRTQLRLRDDHFFL